MLVKSTFRFCTVCGMTGVQETKLHEKKKHSKIADSPEFIWNGDFLMVEFTVRTSREPVQP